jgi:hypothetical protein
VQPADDGLDGGRDKECDDGAATEDHRHDDRDAHHVIIDHRGFVRDDRIDQVEQQQAARQDEIIADDLRVFGHGWERKVFEVGPVFDPLWIVGRGLVWRRGELAVSNRKGGSETRLTFASS